MDPPRSLGIDVPQSPSHHDCAGSLAGSPVIDKYRYIYIYMYIVHICIYTYAYMYTHLYVHIYIYTYMTIRPLWSLGFTGFLELLHIFTVVLRVASRGRHTFAQAYVRELEQVVENFSTDKAAVAFSCQEPKIPCKHAAPTVTDYSSHTIPYYISVYSTVLFYITVYSIILHYTILYYTIPYHTKLNYTILYYTILYDTILY